LHIRRLGDFCKLGGFLQIRKFIQYNTSSYIYNLGYEELSCILGDYLQIRKLHAD